MHKHRKWISAAYTQTHPIDEHAELILLLRNVVRNKMRLSLPATGSYVPLNRDASCF